MSSAGPGGTGRDGTGDAVTPGATRAPAGGFATIDYDDGITAIDSGYRRPMLDAIHLVVEGGRAAIVDTGHNDAVPRVLATLAARGLGPEQVDFVILTHVHLDHAGASGQLMARCPNARLVVHPRGARHMIDPTRLFAATIEVYGEAQARALYGELLPVPAERVIETAHGATVSLAGRALRCLDTPGHAKHHQCIVDGRTGHIFSGDTFGLSYRELDVDGRASVFPSTTPVQFDPPTLHRSVDLLLAHRPEAIYVTHFGQVREVPRLGADLHRLIDAHAALGEANRGAGADRRARLVDGMRRLVLEERRHQGWRLSEAETLAVFEQDIELNADGIAAWLDA